jgi:hypothetical protein
MDAEAAEALGAAIDAALRWVQSGRCLLGSGRCRLAAKAIPQRV